MVRQQDDGDPSEERPSRPSAAYLLPLFLLVQLLAVTALRGADGPGAVDRSFDPGLGSGGAVINALSVQPDGRVLIGGAFRAFDTAPRQRVARLLADGALDGSFMDTGADGEVFAIALQPDGKVLIAGAFTHVGGLTRRYAARLHDNGSVDVDFAPGSGFATLGRFLVWQPDGKVLVGSKSSLVRLNSNASLDADFAIPTFSSGSEVQALALQADGRILLGGSFTSIRGVSRNMVARLNADGTLDASFLATDVGANPTPARCFALLPDGKVLVGGGNPNYSPTREVVVRLLPNGRLDQSFAPAVDTYSTAYDPNVSPQPINQAVVVQSDGRILLAGQFGAVNGETNRNFARLHPDGRRDAHFNTLGGADGAVLAAAALPDGRVLIAGRFKSVDGVPSSGIARLLGDDGPPRISSQPANTSGVVGFPAAFSVTTTNGRPPLQYQWFFNETLPLRDRTNATLTLASVQLADAGSYRVVVSNGLGAATSAVATLTAAVGPRLLSAASLDGASIGLCFDVTVTTNSASNLLNYSITGGGPVTKATLRADGRTVSLSLQTPAVSPFILTASGIADTGPGNLGGGTVTGRVASLTGTNLGRPLFRGSAFSCRDGEFEVLAGGNDVWDNSDEGYFVSAPHTGDFDVKVRAHHLIRNFPNSKAELMVRESLNPDSRTLWLAVMPPPPYRNIYEPGMRQSTFAGTVTWGLPGVTFNYSGNVHASAPDSWMRIKRAGNLFQGFKSANGVDWLKFAEASQTYSNTVHLGLFLGAFATSGQALFRDYDPHYKGPLAVALDTAVLTWTTAGSQPWFVQTAVMHDGPEALQSGAIAHGQSSSVEATLAGPGTLSFWWKVSSEAGADRLTLVRNGADPLEVSGEVDWEFRTLTLPAGSQTLTWTYAKNGDGAAGADAAWLDQVVYAPVPGPPFIVVQPEDLAVKAGSNGVFTVAAANPTDLPMSYQWFFNQTTPVGGPSPALLVNNVGADQPGGYFVVVSNSVGSATSRVATLEFLYEPVIVMQPQSQTNVAGDTVTFTVTVTNNATLPISYRWRRFGGFLTNILLSSPTCSLTLFNVAANQALRLAQKKRRDI